MNLIKRKPWLILVFWGLCLAYTCVVVAQDGAKPKAVEAVRDAPLPATISATREQTLTLDKYQLSLDKLEAEIREKVAQKQLTFERAQAYVRETARKQGADLTHYHIATDEHGAFNYDKDGNLQFLLNDEFKKP